MTKQKDSAEKAIRDIRRVPGGDGSDRKSVKILQTTSPDQGTLNINAVALQRSPDPRRGFMLYACDNGFLIDNKGRFVKWRVL